MRKVPGLNDSASFAETGHALCNVEIIRKMSIDNCAVLRIDMVVLEAFKVGHSLLTQIS